MIFVRYTMFKYIEPHFPQMGNDSEFEVIV